MSTLQSSEPETVTKCEPQRICSCVQLKFEGQGKTLTTQVEHKHHHQRLFNQESVARRLTGPDRCHDVGAGAGVRGDGNGSFWNL